MTLINKILVGVGSSVLFALAWLLVSNANLRTRLAEAHARGNACALANDEFVRHQALQNLAIERLREESAGRQKRADEASMKARLAARRYLAQAEKIRGVRAQGTACQTAEALFHAYLGDLK